MLFLMNDALLDVDLRAMAPPALTQSEALSLSFVVRLGAEMFAQSPLLQRTHPERARRLACLIASASPGVNAALFEAPGAGCKADEVGSRFAEVALDVMASLFAESQANRLTPISIDNRVWRRMAA